ncbi:DUF6366 family protein [Paraliobacillus sediminis]|uniref:DUF6366 family protein n=1 Tax=Paraliobacillus sediminis TaxID=1885916 RepID=UPI000E3EE30D|nr:DUF6366 family protein [Paraliobacillus sediminis]
MNQDDRDRDRKSLEEHQKNPMGNFADSVNHSKTGDLGALAGGGCLTKIITLLVIVVTFLILSQCSI